MNLVADIGNTNIVCGVYRNDELVMHARFKTDHGRTADEYYAMMSSLQNAQWSLEKIKKVVIASVVPELTRIWQHFVSKYLHLSPHLIDGYSPLGLTYNVADPGFIGADLIMNAYAAWKKYSSACIIVDLGTATTIQAVTAQGHFLGTVIAPGIRTAASHLFAKTALLSEIELTAPQSILGTNTREAMLSGIVRGHALMIEGFITKLKEEYSEHKPITSILTGGIADLLLPLIPSLDVMDKTLTLDGLNLASRIFADD